MDALAQSAPPLCGLLLLAKLHRLYMQRALGGTSLLICWDGGSACYTLAGVFTVLAYRATRTV